LVHELLRARAGRVTVVFQDPDPAVIGLLEITDLTLRP
jgi:hypothetical protein